MGRRYKSIWVDGQEQVEHRFVVEQCHYLGCEDCENCDPMDI